MLFHQGNFMNFMRAWESSTRNCSAKSPSRNGCDHEVIGTVIDVFWPLVPLWLSRNTFYSLPPIFLYFISILLKGAKKDETQHVLFLSMQTPHYLRDLCLSCRLHLNFVCFIWGFSRSRASKAKQPRRNTEWEYGGLQKESGQQMKMQWESFTKLLKSVIVLSCQILPRLWRVCSRKWTSLLLIEFN